MSVRAYMTSKPVAVPSSATIADALDTLNAHDIRHLPVMDHGRLVGILSDQDLRMAVTGRPDETEVGEVMTERPVTVSASTPVQAAARMLVERDFGCLPVVENDELVGLLTASDLLRALVETLAEGEAGPVGNPSR